MTSIEKLNIYFNSISTIFFTIIGLIGNSIVFLIFTSKKLRNHSMNRYLACLAISDTIEMLVSWSQIQDNSLPKSSLACKLFNYSIMIFYQYCSCLIILASFDRLITIKYPYKYEFKNKFRFQFILLSCLLVILIIINIPCLIYYDLIEMKLDLNTSSIQVFNLTSELTKVCGFVNPMNGFYINLVYFLILSTLLPFSIMLTCTIMVTIKLIKNKIKMLKYTNRTANISKHGNKRELQLLKIMIGVDLFFFICNIPLCVFISIGNFIQEKILYGFILDIFQVISIMHNTMSFFIYMISNKMFRKQFLQLSSVYIQKITKIFQINIICLKQKPNVELETIPADNRDRDR